MNVVEELYDSFTHYDSTRHLVVPCLWVAGVRSRLGEPGLFVYYHMEADSYVLAIWWQYEPVDSQTPPSGESFVELKVLGGHPDKDDLANGDVEMDGLPSDELILQMLRTWSEIYGEAIEMLEKEKRDEENRRQDAKRHQDDVTKYLGDKYGKNHPEVVGIKDGSIPWMSPEMLKPSERDSYTNLLKGE